MFPFRDIEIIPKPPSHPITTSLLITGSVACIIAIGFIWNELFSCYLVGAKAPAEYSAGMENHTFAKETQLQKQATPEAIATLKKLARCDNRIVRRNARQRLHQRARSKSP